MNAFDQISWKTCCESRKKSAEEAVDAQTHQGHHYLALSNKYHLHSFVEKHANIMSAKSCGFFYPPPLPGLHFVLGSLRFTKLAKHNPGRVVSGRSTTSVKLKAFGIQTPLISYILCHSFSYRFEDGRGRLTLDLFKSFHHSFILTFLNNRLAFYTHKA